MVDLDLEYLLVCLMKKGFFVIYFCKCLLLKYLNIVLFFKYVYV